MNKRVNVKFVGCRLNQFESDYIKSEFLSEGYESSEKNADICVINTCTVTKTADTKSRKLIRKLKKANPDALMVATGCMVETNKKDLEDLNLIDVFVSNNEKMNISSILKKGRRKNQSDIMFTPGRTRPSIKIQDGCDHNCTYCKVTIARGNSRSESFEKIRKTAEFLAYKGFKEIVLSGINIGDYNDKKRHLKHLLKSLIKIEGLERIRLSSIEPTYITRGLLDVLKHKKICKYFHVPLQSGSDKILKKMKRPYNKNKYEEVIRNLQALDTGVVIGADVIVGFPGETETDFQDTFNLLSKNNIFYLHVFRYSSRENTAASKFDGVVPEKEKIRRHAILTKYSDNRKEKFFRGLTGNYLDVIVETKIKQSKYIIGMSSNYIPVLLPLKKYKDKTGEILNIKIKRTDKNAVYEV